ncbi:helix-turn-helix domain-containing protein [Hymenobacter nivis]|uniref:helix-turn-helix domain-containing protein n=1 Tax=Hymenobacter nivis TaxID=1850093 RepID=UPI001B87C272|nr:helix-turn-helix domain-containing protein [Hymenobacter nivis]
MTPEERQTLEGWQKKYKSHSPKLQRIQILLNSDEQTGRRPAADLAAVLGVCTRTVERVRRQFCEEGMALFEPKPRKTRSDKKIDGRVEAHLLALLCQTPPDEQPRWQLQLLADQLVELQVVEHISTTMVARLLKKTNSSRSTARSSG